MVVTQLGVKRNGRDSCCEHGSRKIHEGLRKRRIDLLVVTRQPQPFSCTVSISIACYRSFLLRTRRSTLPYR